MSDWSVLALVAAGIAALHMMGLYAVGDWKSPAAWAYSQDVFVLWGILALAGVSVIWHAYRTGASVPWLLIVIGAVGGVLFLGVRSSVRTGVAKSARLEGRTLTLEFKGRSTPLDIDRVKRVGRIVSSPWMPVPGHFKLGPNVLLVESTERRAFGAVRWVVRVESAEGLLERLDTAGFRVVRGKNLW